MFKQPPGRFLPGAGRHRRREPRTSDLVLGITAVLVLLASALSLLAAAA